MYCFAALDDHVWGQAAAYAARAADPDTFTLPLQRALCCGTWCALGDLVYQVSNIGDNMSELRSLE